MTKKLLAQKPVEHIIGDLGRLTLGWSLAESRFTVKLNNIPHSNLAKTAEETKICRQKVVNTVSGSKMRSGISFDAIFYNKPFLSYFTGKRSSSSFTVSRASLYKQVLIFRKWLL